MFNIEAKIWDVMNWFSQPVDPIVLKVQGLILGFMGALVLLRGSLSKSNEEIHNESDNKSLFYDLAIAKSLLDKRADSLFGFSLLMLAFLTQIGEAVLFTHEKPDMIIALNPFILTIVYYFYVLEKRQLWGVNYLAKKIWKDHTKHVGVNQTDQISEKEYLGRFVLACGNEQYVSSMYSVVKSKFRSKAFDEREGLVKIIKKHLPKSIKLKPLDLDY